MSVATPGAPLVESGGYRVQPVTEPPEAREYFKPQTINSWGAMSLATTNNEYSQFPSHPRSPGILFSTFFDCSLDKGLLRVVEY